MSMTKNMVGLRFGRLLVISLVAKEKDKKPNGAYWRCICDCGQEVIIYGTRLRIGQTKSCGCLRRDGKGSPKQFSDTERLFHKYQNAAKCKKLEWNLSLKEFEELILKNCIYCGAVPTKTSSNIGSLKYNGIDRLNNQCGYTRENSASCCHFCNFKKRDTSYVEFISWIQRVAKYHKKLG